MGLKEERGRTKVEVRLGIGKGEARHGEEKVGARIGRPKGKVKEEISRELGLMEGEEKEATTAFGIMEEEEKVVTKAFVTNAGR